MPNLKKKLFTRLKDHKYFVILCGLFLVTGLILAATWYKYQINPDATSYFTIAKKYAHFEIRDAVNSYWGPLLSLMLVPGVWFGVSLVVFAKCLAVVSVVTIMTIAYTFLITRKLDKKIATVTSAIIGIVLFPYALPGPITPDLLNAVWTLLFACQLISLCKSPTRKNILLISIFGALMYLTKSFGLYLFIGTVLVTLAFNLRDFKNGQGIKYLTSYMYIGLVFALIVLPFIAAISIKEGRPTISSAGRFNLNFAGPNSKETYFPPRVSGPLDPPNKSAVSVWENPALLTALYPDDGWSPLKSLSSFRYYIHSIFLKNIKLALHIIKTSSLLVSLGLLIVITGSLRKGKYQEDSIVFAALSLLTILGYSLILLEERYMLAVLCIGIVASSIFFDRLIHKALLNRTQYIFICGLLIFFSCWVSASDIINKRYINASFQKEAVQLGEIVAPGSNVLSDVYEATYVCYYLQSNCYGVFNDTGYSLPEYHALLLSKNIKYYFDYSYAQNSPAVQEYLGDYARQVHVVDSDSYQLSVYELKNN